MLLRFLSYSNFVVKVTAAIFNALLIAGNSNLTLFILLNIAIR